MSEESDVDDVVRALYASWLLKHPVVRNVVDSDPQLSLLVEDCFRDAYEKGVRYPFEQFKVCPMCRRKWQP